MIDFLNNPSSELQRNEIMIIPSSCNMYESKHHWYIKCFHLFQAFKISKPAVTVNKTKDHRHRVIKKERKSIHIVVLNTFPVQSSNTVEMQGLMLCHRELDAFRLWPSSKKPKCFMPFSLTALMYWSDCNSHLDLAFLYWTMAVVWLDSEQSSCDPSGLRS